MNFQQAVDNDIEFANRMMEQDGGLNHIVIGYMQDGKRLLTVLRCQDGNEKEIAAKMLRIIFAVNDVKFYTHMSEAWMASGGSREEMMNIVPSEQPDRVEVVMVNGVSESESVSKIYKIVRASDEKFEKLELMPEYDNLAIEGRFATLLDLEGLPRGMVVSAGKRILENYGVPPFMDVYIMEGEPTVH